MLPRSRCASDCPTPRYPRGPPADPRISHLSLTFSPMVTLHAERWKMLTKKRNSSPLGQVPHCLSQQTLTLSMPGTAPGAFQTPVIQSSQPLRGRELRHPEVKEFSRPLKQHLAPEPQIFTSALCSPYDTPACLPIFTPLLITTAILLTFPLLKCFAHHPFPFFFLSALFFFFIGRSFHTYRDLISRMQMSVDLLSRLDNVLCARRDTSASLPTGFPTPDTKLGSVDAQIFAIW